MKKIKFYAMNCIWQRDKLQESLVWRDSFYLFAQSSISQLKNL